MTDSTATAPTQPALDNLAQLMSRARRTGAIDEIGVVHTGIGTDLPAPTGWMLFLRRFGDGTPRWQYVEDDSLTHLRIEANPDRPEPSAYLKGGYLRGHEPLDWIDQPRPEWAGAPDTDAGSARTDIELMTKAIANGWDVEFRMTRGRMPGTGPATHIATSLTFKAINWHYNDQASAWSAERDVPVDFQMTLGRHVDEDGAPVSPGAWDYSLLGAEPIPAERVLELLDGLAPWPQLVATYDDDRERWVVPPALQVPDAWALDPRAYALSPDHDKEPTT